MVTKTGDMDRFKVVKGIQQEECDAEALNAVKQMKKWHPGSLNGKAVSVKYVMPIKFKLTLFRKSGRIRIRFSLGESRLLFNLDAHPSL